ncbi:hypothetical protein NKH69_33925 [Mesorhizobium sp. M0976]|uniref:FtsB family cell division protein n=1 Tax=Mesorhizobium sp. M0976 TaxID=2957038 RepID=UPI00333C605E
MTLPPTDSLEGLSLAELRGLVSALIGEVRGLRGRVESLEIENQALRAENKTLKDEIARLKDLPPRPPVTPTKPSGMEKATQPTSGKDKRRRRGPKRDGGRVSRTVTVAVSAPAGPRFKGYETILVRDLALSAEVVRYRRERWVTPTGETMVAPLPAGIMGREPAPLHSGLPHSRPGDDGAVDSIVDRDRGRHFEAPGGAADFGGPVGLRGGGP